MTRRGFTLIELLVVIAIIGLLSSVVLAALQDARARGRDSKRLQDLVELQKAIELFYDDNGVYPLACDNAVNVYKGETTSGCATHYVEGLVPKYLSQLPHDPAGVSTNGYLYRVGNSARQNYKIMVYKTLETLAPVSGTANARCSANCALTYCTQSPPDNSMARYSPGAACW